MSLLGGSTKKLILCEDAGDRRVKGITVASNDNKNIISLTKLKDYMPRDKTINSTESSTIYGLGSAHKECRFFHY